MYKLGLAAFLVVVEFILARITRLDMDQGWPRRPHLSPVASLHPGAIFFTSPSAWHSSNLSTYEELLARPSCSVHHHHMGVCYGLNSAPSSPGPGLRPTPFTTSPPYIQLMVLVSGLCGVTRVPQPVANLQHGHLHWLRVRAEGLPGGHPTHGVFRTASRPPLPPSRGQAPSTRRRRRRPRPQPPAAQPPVPSRPSPATGHPGDRQQLLVHLRHTRRRHRLHRCRTCLSSFVAGWDVVCSGRAPARRLHARWPDQASSTSTNGSVVVVPRPHVVTQTPMEMTAPMAIMSTTLSHAVQLFIQ